MLDLVHRIGTEFGISVVVCSHLLGEVEQIADGLVAIEAGRLLRADRVSSMTARTAVLAVEVDEGADELAAALSARGVRIGRDGAALMTPVTSPATYDLVRDVIVDLGLPLHRLEERRHRVAELFGSPAAHAAAPAPAGADEGRSGDE
jgi:ABC-2 type transport system ATP-binding protein